MFKAKYDKMFAIEEKKKEGKNIRKPKGTFKKRDKEAKA